MAASNAVSSNAVSTITGFLLAKGFFNTVSPNLPQTISILAEANTANQSGLDVTPYTVTNSAQVAARYGSGSPMHIISRILFPQSGGGVSVPVICYPQLAAVSSVAKVMTLTPTGTATDTGTIYLKIAGREIVDGASYGINIVTGDTPTVIAGKMRTAIAAALSCPLIGSGTTTLVTTAKWTGLTSQDITMSVDLNGTSLGVTYAIVETTPGSGTPAVTAALTSFGSEWHTIVINSYGLVSATMVELETYNGIPDPVNPTGQFSGTIMRPMFAFSGTVLDDPTSITSAGVRPNNVTIVPCVAPLSLGLGMEAAANYAVLWSNVAQNTPNSDIINQALPDMPAPTVGSIPQMNAYAFRDYCVQHGCSTAEFTGGVYVSKDFVTTYNKVGEYPPFYRYVRDLNIYYNYKFGYYILEQTNLVGKTLVNDDSIVTVANVIKPKVWKSLVAGYNIQCESRALIADAKGFSNPSIQVTINATNPQRMDTIEEIKITGMARIAATTVYGGFNFGTQA